MFLPSALRPGPGTGHVLLRAQAPEDPPQPSSVRAAQQGRQHPAPGAEPAPPERRRGHGAPWRADGRPRQPGSGEGEAEAGPDAEDALAHRQGAAAASSVQARPQVHGNFTW